MCVRPLWHCETLKLSWGGADALWWSVCVYHLSLCVNILLGNSPSISSGMTTFSPLCLPTGHTAHKFYSDKSSELVMHCTQYDSQRWLLKTDLSTAGGGSNWTQAASADWHLPLPMLGNGVWYARPGFLGASPGVGGGDCMCWWQLSSCHVEWDISDRSTGEASCSFPTQLNYWLTPKPHLQ